MAGVPPHPNETIEGGKAWRQLHHGWRLAQLSATLRRPDMANIAPAATQDEPTQNAGASSLTFLSL